MATDLSTMSRPRAGQHLTGERAKALEVGRRGNDLARRAGVLLRCVPHAVVLNQIQTLVAVSDAGDMTLPNRGVRQRAMLGRDVVAHSGNPAGMPRPSGCEQGMHCIAPCSSQARNHEVAGAAQSLSDGAGYGAKVAIPNTLGPCQHPDKGRVSTSAVAL